MEVMLNAVIGSTGKSLWAEPHGIAARAYGIATCLDIKTWARYTPVRFK